MFTLLIGILIVAASTAGFGFALFGRRPVPQPAMQLATAPSVAALAEVAPSSARAGNGADVLVADRVEPPIEGRRARDVTITPWVRLRSSLLLALTVLGIAAILGAVLSVLVVGIVFIAT
jgi:hypothetical protein